MGIYDRDYIQDRPGGFGLFVGGGSVVKTLILINVAVFLLGWLGGPPLRIFLDETFAARSESIVQHFQVWRLLTYAFLHDPSNLFHILWNMIFLWFVGRELEEIYGHRDFLTMYLTAAIIAGLCWSILDLSQGGQARMVGASGAVAAALFIYVLYYPNREILLFFVLPVPMWMFAIIFFGRDLLGLIQSLQGSTTAPIAFAAHLSGAAYGFLYKKYDLRWSRITSGWSWRWGRRSRLKIFTPEPRTRRPSRQGAKTPARSGSAGQIGSSGMFPDEHLDAKLDEILAKIAREGRSGLTEEENRILQEASERARNRRGERLR
ncbi:rhomboid family intramembrane serine protease [Tautonia rosea]|uniref:rhomboid family intramembrane serine protease n=1 Tax=Tautonia rosea TaxID=2728037 RepID=UPI001474754F|nr:rhomboid family intramembrane serine protease [Tautonia rosea]